MLKDGRDFAQQFRDETLRDDLQDLVRLALREDLATGLDLSTLATVPAGLQSSARIVSRVGGVACGIDLLAWIIEPLGLDIQVKILVADALAFRPRTTLATLTGDARDLLTCERIVLNFLGRLCGIASWTQQHARLIADMSAQLYDTRKTTPGWRRLEKYAVHCGGGRNHRGGLYDAILIKDNHLACHQRSTGDLLAPGEAIARAREFIRAQPDLSEDTIVEIEVDTLEQLAAALAANPDIVLLDNMSNEQLRHAVSMRNEADDSAGRGVQLEASGGVNLATLREIAATGVDRISVGALTHSAVNLDLGLDWD